MPSIPAPPSRPSSTSTMAMAPSIRVRIVKARIIPNKFMTVFLSVSQGARTVSKCIAPT